MNFVGGDCERIDPARMVMYRIITRCIQWHL
jgi:hypothetical protein